MSGHVADSLVRLQAAVNAAIEHRAPTVVVEVRDVRALLAERDRLDADARIGYPVHTSNLRASLAQLREALVGVDAALFAMPSARELERRREDETRRRYPPHGATFR